MKHLIVRCEDRAPDVDRIVPLLSGAKTAHLLQLAQAGSAGTVRVATAGAAVDWLDVHRGLMGLPADAPEAAPGNWYAAAVNLEFGPGEGLWCCDFMTQTDGVVVDGQAGRVTTREGRLLMQALDEQLGSDARRWEVGDAGHHLLAVSESGFPSKHAGRVTPPQLLIGQEWRKQLPKGELGQALGALMEQAAKVLESHPVNRVRLDLGENPANAIWLWGGSQGRPQSAFLERTGLSGAMVSNQFPMRGFARCTGLGWEQGPESSDETAFHRLAERVKALLDRHDVVYVHLVVESQDPVERLCAMERLDQLLLKPFTEQVATRSPLRFLMVVDNRMSQAVPFVAIGGGLAAQPVVQLTDEALAQSGARFDDSAELAAWFLQVRA